MIGVYSNKDQMQKRERFIKNLATARRTLEDFRSLDKIFHGFRQYENEYYTRNAVLLMCREYARSRGKTITFETSRVWRGRLTELEEAIELFDVFSWGTRKFKDFESRLTSKDFIQSRSVCTELLIAKRLADRLGKENVVIFPRIETGLSDILAKLDDKVVYLEVGNLSESLPEKKIQRILDETAKILGSKLKDQCYFSVTVDTAEFVFDQDGNIDERASIEKIASEFDRFCFDRLKGYDGSVSLEEIAWPLANKELLEKMDKTLLDPHTKRSLKLFENPTLRKWIDLCKDQIVQGSRLIKGGLICKRLNFLLVEIRTFGMFPSASATAELNSFNSHFIRHVKEQINQLEPKKPNIIAVEAHNWMLLPIGFEPLYTRIQQFFNDKKEPYLSGVVVLRSKRKSVYLNNDYATESSRLTKEDVEMLDFKWR